MISVAIGLLLGLLAVILVALYASFTSVSQRELKRRARSGDAVAAVLYRSVSYGLPTKIVVGGLTALFAYGALVLWVNSIGAGWSFVLCVIFVVAALYLARTKARLRKLTLGLAMRLSPAVAWLVERLHGPLDWCALLVRKFLPVHIHSGMYEKEDLVALLQAQKHQLDNRITPGELDLISHALTFGDQKVGDVLVPKRVVKMVAVGDAVGPVLMDELHDSGHSRFPVYDDKRDNLVGVLYMHDLVAAKQSGVVRDIMRPKVAYVHEEFTLYQTLQAFIKTKQHLFIVVNSFEEFVGIITIEDVLERVIGKPIVDEFDTYDDLRAVAAADARKEHNNHQKQHPQPDAATGPAEVVQ